MKGINDLATLKPELAAEWSKKNTLKPTEVSIGSHLTTEYTFTKTLFLMIATTTGTP